MTQTHAELACSLARDENTSRAEYLCAVHGVDPSRVLCQQFLLTTGQDTTPTGLSSVRLGQWTLFHGADLPLARCRLGDDAHVAVLGVAVDRDGQVIDDRRLQELGATCGDPQTLVRFLNDSAGRYLIIVDSASVQRIYPDGFGSLGVVYDRSTQRIGSTVNLVLTREPDWNRAYPLTGNALLGNARFAFGHTEDRLVQRLLPNHFLDMRKFKPKRFWPMPDDLQEPEPDQADAVTGTIVERLEQVIAALATHASGDLHLPLSGGLDSRILLACAKPVLGKISLFSHAESRMSQRDTEIARDLASAVDRPIRIVDPLSDPTQRIDSAARRFLLQQQHRIVTGLISAPSETLLNVLYAHPRGGLFLRGNGVDFLKAVLWRRGVREYIQQKPHNISMGLRMMMLSDKTIIDNPVIRAAYERWFASLSENARARAYDLMFAEQFLSHGFGNLLYSFENNFYICPFNDRRLLGWATSLPPDGRASLLANLAILQSRAPELLDIPYTRSSVNDHLSALRQTSTETAARSAA